MFFTHTPLLCCVGDSTNEGSSQDLTSLPDLTFAFVEKYAKDKSGCESTTKAYKFFAEPGYLHDIKGKLCACRFSGVNRVKPYDFSVYFV